MEPLPAGPWLRIPEFVVTFPQAITNAELGRRQWLPFCYFQILPLPLLCHLFEIDPLLQTTWLVGILGRRSLKAADQFWWIVATVLAQAFSAQTGLVKAGNAALFAISTATDVGYEMVRAQCLFVTRYNQLNIPCKVSRCARIPDLNSRHRRRWQFHYRGWARGEWLFAT